MSFFPSFLFVLLCLSMHACLARHFVFVKVGGKQKIDSVQGMIDRAVTTPVQPNMFNSKDISISQSSGVEIFKSSSLVVPLKATHIEGSRRRRRGLSVVRFENSNYKNANKNKVEEDAEVIDYDPPHRTPPIHNRKVLEKY
ncbi:uncharacterized protein LOC8266069 [Ricinus communis]|uniref:uncharacterized protein LOC8266069 n=1 Tax=Ricinus communis TaxID=3988 RepID=UPI0007726C0A|nr:uncharacterized protein LOC8266069 [Ricinus communis]|eukprot:XP_015579376.1 uncharacterized protein LOC8266069 [Ricinus communis]